MQGYFEITINGTCHRVSRVAFARPFLTWLREDLGLQGTKAGACGHGACAGACTICVLDTDGRGQSTYRAVPGCGLTLPMAAGRQFITVEALDGGSEAHPVVRALASVGTRGCGYCASGLAMALFEIYYRQDLTTMEDVYDALAGHNCRCGSAQAVREAVVVLVRESRELRHRSHVPGKIERARGRRKAPVRIRDDAFDAALNGFAPDPGALAYIDPDGSRFHRPRSLLELLRLRKEYVGERLIGGGTGFGSRRVRGGNVPQCVISTESVVEMRSVFDLGQAWEIGAAVSLTVLQETVSGQLAPLERVLSAFGSRASRNRATLGGALCAPESAGEIGPVLVALGASATIASLEGEREIPLEEFLAEAPGEFLRGEEILKAVRVPRIEGPGRLCGVMRIAPRLRNAPSIASVALNLELDGELHVVAARISTGAAWARPIRAVECENALIGQVWNGATVKLAAQALRGAAPAFSDDLASGEYRRAVTGALFQKFFYENPTAETKRELDTLRGLWLAQTIIGESVAGSGVVVRPQPRPLARQSLAEASATHNEFEGDSVKGNEPGEPAEAIVIGEEKSVVSVESIPVEAAADSVGELAMEIIAESEGATVEIGESGAALERTNSEAESSEAENSEILIEIDPEVFGNVEVDEGEDSSPPAIEIVLMDEDVQDESLESIFKDGGDVETDVVQEAVIEDPEKKDTGPPLAEDANGDEVFESIFVEIDVIDAPGDGSEPSKPSGEEDDDALFANVFVNPDEAEAPDEVSENTDSDRGAPPEEPEVMLEESPSVEIENEPRIEDIFEEPTSGTESSAGEIEAPPESPNEAVEGSGPGAPTNPAVRSVELESASASDERGESETKASEEPEQAINVLSASELPGVRRAKLPPPRKVSLEVRPRNGLVIEKEDSAS